ncbi:hypothetical protein QYF48_25900, partial [Brevibacillus agri]
GTQGRTHKENRTQLSRHKKGWPCGRKSFWLNTSKNVLLPALRCPVFYLVFPIRLIEIIDEWDGKVYFYIAVWLHYSNE